MTSVTPACSSASRGVDCRSKRPSALNCSLRAFLLGLTVFLPELHAPGPSDNAVLLPLANRVLALLAQIIARSLHVAVVDKHSIDHLLACLADHRARPCGQSLNDAALVGSRL